MGQFHAGSLVLGSVSLSSYKPRLVDSVYFFSLFLTPLVPIFLPSSFPQDIPCLVLCLTVALHLFLPVAEWSLSGDYWGYAPIYEYIGSMSWHSRQCKGWACSFGVVISLDQSLVGHYHNLCATLTPEYPIDQKVSGLKMEMLGWCCSFSAESHAWS